MASKHSTNEINKYDVVVVGSGAAGLVTPRGSALFARRLFWFIPHSGDDFTSTIDIFDPLRIRPAL